MTVPLPAGLHIDPDLDTVALEGDALLGGTPRRMMRLSAAGRTAWAELRQGPVGSPASAVLARRLTDAGLAHPRPRPAERCDVTVVIPVRDRAEMLDRCLASLPGAAVTVVDDGSTDAAAIASVCGRHGARLVRHDVSRGPAAARNTGLVGLDTELVAFLDSDCVAPPGWLPALAGHFDDPLVGAVAPRVVAQRDMSGGASSSSYLQARSVLDLGERAARVQPGSRVAFVPTAALVVRRSALESLAEQGPVFDPALRYGEDVDLVWRLDAAGWRVRYDPSVTVAHDEPARWSDRLGRRFRYGTSAAPLSQRHVGALAPLSLSPWPTAAVVALLMRRPVPAVVALGAGVAATRRAIGASGVRGLSAPRLTATAVGHTWEGLGRYLTQAGVPLALAALVARRGRIPLAALVVGPPLVRHLVRDSGSTTGVRPARYAAGQVADDLAYGAGVWAGAIRQRTLAPVLPVVVRSRRHSRGAH